MNLVMDSSEEKVVLESKVNTPDLDIASDEVLFQEGGLDGPEIRYGYQTGGMRYLVPKGAISELIQGIKIYHLPNAPKWVCGLINLHGNVIPVIDIVSMTGNEISHLSKSNILAIKNNESTIGVLIDGLPEAITKNDDYDKYNNSINQLPVQIRKFTVEGLLFNGNVWFELDIFSLLRELALLKASI